MKDKLSLQGGKPVVPRGMVKPWPYITNDDRQAVLSVLDAKNLSDERLVQVDSLAREWASYLGVRYCLPCSSGTAALHMALVAIGVEPGDEVILPALTYWSTAAAILHQNAIPVFVDIEPHSFCINSSQLEMVISERTKAIIPVHIHGMPVDMDAILKIAKRHDLAVIEDAAQAHGAMYKGRKCGSFGTAAAFSLEMSKNLTTGSVGGLFVTNDETICKRADSMRLFKEIASDFNIFGLGWIYRGDVFGQAFARSQLLRLDEYNELRRKNCEYLTHLLSQVKGVRPPAALSERKEVFYNYVLELVPAELGITCSRTHFRDTIQKALQAEGVEIGLWQDVSVPALDVFQKKIGYGKGCPWSCRFGREVQYNVNDFPISNHFFESHLYIFGITPPNGLELMGLYAEAIQKVLGNIEMII